MERDKLKEFLKTLTKEQLEKIIFKNYEYIVDEFERFKREVEGFKKAKMDKCLKTSEESKHDFELMLKHLDNLISKEGKSK